MFGIDIVIPSFRVDENYIVPILDLRVPVNCEVKFFLVIDNPELQIPLAVSARINQKTVFCYQNTENKGAALTRNKGIDMGSAEWVLFLDDDIVVPSDLLLHYKKAIEQWPEETGFIGLVQFPPAGHLFTRAVVASGSMDIFSIAKLKDEHVWGATANMMVRRKAIGQVRFSEMYPKAGGGEDVDFFLRIYELNQHKKFKTLPSAAVEHPWWKSQAADYRRPFRYGRGNTILAIRNPQYIYRDFFNTVELLVILIPVVLVFLFLDSSLARKIVVAIAAAAIVDYIATATQVLKRTRQLHPAIVYYTMMLRLSFQAGALTEAISRGRWQGFTERFNESGSLRRNHFFRFNTYKIVKWILYPLAGWLIWKYIH